MIRKIFAFCLSFFFFVFIFASTINAGWVNGYYRRDGTYVNGYYRSDPNGLRYDNYSWRRGQSLYNDSYYDCCRSYNWYTPSWSWQSDYWQGLNSYRNNNYYRGW